MSVSPRSLALALFASTLAVGLQLGSSQAIAGKAQFERTKPHMNVGTTGSHKSAPSKFKQPGGKQNKGLGGPRKDKIDLSVCELGTFDFEKCLG